MHTGSHMCLIPLYNAVAVLFTPNSFPFYDLMGIPGVKELPRTVDAISEPIYFNRSIPLQFRLAGKAFVSKVLYITIKCLITFYYVAWLQYNYFPLKTLKQLVLELM